MGEKGTTAKNEKKWRRHPNQRLVDGIGSIKGGKKKKRIPPVNEAQDH